MCYEQTLEDMQTDANKLQCNTVGFNLRGVSKSTGKALTKDDLLTDCIAQVQRLLDKGVSPENIVLKGLSIGGALLTLTTYYFHQLNLKINVFNDRSFSTTSQLLISQIPEDQTKLTKVATFCEPSINILLQLLNWQVDVVKAYQAIPDQYKEYLVVRTRKSNRMNTVIDDKAIPHSASLHIGLKSQRKELKRQLRQTAGETNQFAARKMEPIDPTVCAHVVSSTKLTNRYGTSAHTFFTEFVQRTQTDHAITQTTYSKLN